MDKNYDVIIFILGQSRVANFADIINMSTIFTKPKNQKKFKKIRNYVLKYNLRLYLLT